MKKIERIKLNQLSMVELDQRRMNTLRGGSCKCTGCYCGGNGAYSADGVSSTDAVHSTDGGSYS